MAQQITNEKLQRAEQVRSVVHGRRCGSGVLQARVWTGRDRVRVYVTRGGKQVCWFGFPGSAVTVSDSVLGPDHAELMAAVEVQVGPLSP